MQVGFPQSARSDVALADMGAGNSGDRIKPGAMRQVTMRRYPVWKVFARLDNTLPQDAR